MIQLRSLVLIGALTGIVAPACDTSRGFNDEEEAGKGGGGTTAGGGSSGKSTTAGKGGTAGRSGGSAGSGGDSAPGGSESAGGTENAGSGGSGENGGSGYIPASGGSAGEAGSAFNAGGESGNGDSGSSGQTGSGGQAGDGASGTTSGGASGTSGTSSGGTSGTTSGGSAGIAGSGGSTSCVPECTSGQTSCASGQSRTCQQVQNCWVWSTPVACASGQCLDTTDCFVCDNECTSGSSSCSAGDIRVCEEDSDGCFAWSGASDCPSGACASTTACVVCNNTCNAGAVDCVGTAMYQCVTDSQGCRAFSGTPSTTCSGDTPVCDETDKRCECNATTPQCVDADTARTCSSGVWSTPTDCGASAPVCVDGAGCQPCTEHQQCPTTACHLSGTKKGTCFAASTVVQISTVTALESNIASLTTGAERVFKLSGNTFNLSAALQLGSNAEVAIVGQTGTSLIHGTLSGDARNSIVELSTGITYISRVSLTGNTSRTGIGLSFGAELWLDDSRVSGSYIALSSSGTLHVRRSSLRSATLASSISGGLAFIENSAIGPNGTGVGGINLGSTGSPTIDFRYVTIAGSEYAVQCNVSVPPIAGSIRNSILTSLAGTAVAGGTNGSNCSAVQFSGNAVNMGAPFGTTIGWYNAAWFANAPAGDFHLTTAGRAAIPRSAARGSGDPLVDIDGHSRPTSSGTPGVDE